MAEDVVTTIVVAADPHVEEEGGGAGTAVSQEWLTADLQGIGEAEPEARFVVVVGDLTENGTEAELSAYATAAMGSSLPVHSVFGGHDALDSHRADAVDQTRFYRDIVGPLWYAFDAGSLRCVALVSEFRFLTCEQEEAQGRWLRNELAGLAPDRDLVVFQHTPPTPELLEVLAGHRLRAVCYGHYHRTKIHRADGVLMAGAPGLCLDGFDGDPRGYLRIEATPEGICSRRGILGARRHPRPSARQGRAIEADDLGDDWSDFHGGPNRRVLPATPGRRLPGKTLTVCWHRSLDVPLLLNSPIIVGRRLFAATQGRSGEEGALHCLDALDGTEIWRRSLSAPAHHTPAAGAGRVCVQTVDGGLQCLDAGDGRIAWRARIESGPDRRGIPTATT